MCAFYLPPKCGWLRNVEVPTFGAANEIKKRREKCIQMEHGTSADNFYKFYARPRNRWGKKFGISTSNFQKNKSSRTNKMLSCHGLMNIDSTKHIPFCRIFLSKSNQALIKVFPFRYFTTSIRTFHVALHVRRVFLLSTNQYLLDL